MAFQRIHIVVAAPMQERARLFALDESAGRSALSEEDLIPQKGQREFWSQTEVACLDAEQLQRDFSSLQILTSTVMPAAAFLYLFPH